MPGIRHLITAWRARLATRLRAYFGLTDDERRIVLLVLLLFLVGLAVRAVRLLAR